LQRFFSAAHFFPRSQIQSIFQKKKDQKYCFKMDNVDTFRKRQFERNFVLAIICNSTVRDQRNVIKREEVLVQDAQNKMEEEEVNEKHLRDAIRYKSKIPVPKIVEINREEYEKLYPATHPMPKPGIVTHRKSLYLFAKISSLVT
jgi:hypothetical protein